MNGYGHTPVLLKEVLEYLEVQRSGIYVDCTVGLGGHASEILKANSETSLIGFDIDEISLIKAKDRLQPYADRVTLYHSDFRYLPDLNMDFSKIRGILIDLGLSSFQLDSAERGFSYNQEGPLDMRMDLRNKINASRILNKYSEHRLAHVFREFGELRQANRLAKAIASKRKTEKFTTTRQLFRIVEDVCHWRTQKGKTHPAARVFQALRIEVNQELKGLSHFLERIIPLCPSQARVVVISFHSLEDRIVKRAFAYLAIQNDHPPCIKILTKKPVIPSADEIEENFRSRSAKLRAAERI
jgi:16S rRNA (cytosine1402-N4)-methyltransferase